MGQKAKYLFALDDGRRVGGTPKQRGGFFKVQFRHPTELKYREAATGVVVPKGWHPDKRPPDSWFDEAEKAIRAAYTPPVRGPVGATSKATWEEAEALLLQHYGRDGSRRTYQSALSLVRSALPDLAGPADLTTDDANHFARRYATGTFRRTKREGGEERPRCAQTIRTTLNNLSVVWARFKKLRLVAANVWTPDEVERPRVPKKLPRVPPEEAIDNLRRWLDRRFPGPDGNGWPLLRAFIGVKMFAGCRLNDLCQAKSWQFDPKAGTLLITADADKTHQERAITLPSLLVDLLDGLKGPTYLWEQYATDSATYRPGKGRSKEFSPSVIYHAVKSIFREYGKAHPEMKVKTHDLRKRAITLTLVATGGDYDATAQAIPVTGATARGHYVDRTRVYNAADVQQKAAPLLLGNWFGPQTGPTPTVQPGGN